MKDFLIYINNHFILFVLSISLLILVFIASRINKKDKRILISILTATLLLAIFEYLETLFSELYVNSENFPRYLLSSLCYILRPTIIVLFYHIRLSFKTKRYFLIWIGVLLNATIYILALFAYKNPNFRFVYWYNEYNLFCRTWLGYTVHFICGGYLLGLAIASIVSTTINKTRRQIDIFILITVVMAALAQGLCMGLNLSNSYTTEVFVLGAAIYFIYLNYDKAATDAVVFERDMQAKTTALMLSQIQPHFIYNTLATIQVLCEIDALKASETIADFSKYLRMNTDALSKTEPVPVIEEINHAMAYSKIEMTRFDNVNVTFSVQDKDFKLPVLTIEPLVENAIKYGVRARKDGLVEVMTYKEGNNHILVIKDNGIGFDLAKLQNDGKVHVGINNVKTRVENMVNGTFKIESVLDQGTKVTIIIPEE